MFAIDHAATALLLKKRYSEQPIVPLLIAVQLMELIWAILNLLKIERTTTEEAIRSVSDIHLAFMPYSHSIASSLVFALLAWIVSSFIFHRRKLGFVLALGVISHLLLDLVTHAPDIAVAPGFEQFKLGLGLYSTFPMGAFALELLYGIACWWVYQGGKALLAIIVLFNVANLPLLSPTIPGPESFLASKPTLIVLIISAQIIVTLVLVGYFSARGPSR